MNPFLDKLLRQSMGYGVASIINILCRFVWLSILWRSLSDTAQRHYALLGIVTALVLIFADIGLETTIIRFFKQNNAILFFARRLFSRISIVIIVPVTIIVSIGWFLYAGTWDGAAACLMAWGTAVFQIASASFRAQTDVRRFLVYSNLRSVIITLVLLSLYGLVHQLSLFTWMITQGGFSMLFGLAIIARHGDGWKKTVIEKTDEKRYMAFLVPLAVTNLALWCEGLIDMVILNIFRPEEIALYRLLLDYAVFFSFLGVVINRSWPALLFSDALGRDNQPRAADKPVLLSLLTNGLAILAMTAAAPPLLSLLWGRTFPLSLCGAVALVLAANSFFIQIAIMRPYLEFDNRTRTILRIYCAGLVISLAANWLLIPGFGILGAAASGSITLFSMFWLLFFSITSFERRMHTAMLCLLVQVLFGFALWAICSLMG